MLLPLPDLTADRLTCRNFTMQVPWIDPLEELAQGVLPRSYGPDHNSTVLDHEIDGGPFHHLHLSRK